MGKDMTAEERRSKVAELTTAGKSEREIARELGVSRTTVWNDKQVVAATIGEANLAALDAAKS